MLHTSKLSLRAAGLMSFLCAGLARADYALNLQAPHSEMARTIFDLHTSLLLICTVIFVLVFGVMFYSMFKHRKSVGHKAANFHENVTVEVVWTVVPFLILLAMAWPATKAVLSQKDTRGADMTIKVTGYQWKWGYDYIEEGISFYSTLVTPRTQIENTETKGKEYLLEVDNPLVVPVGKKVRIITTANDVIHSWWVPAFGVKQDAIPGFLRETWFKAEAPGIYRGQCTELCGKDHGFMPIVVEVKSAEDYKTWVDAQKKKMPVSAVASKQQVAAGEEKTAEVAIQDDPEKVWTMADLKARGEMVYNTNCVSCHQAQGQGIPGTFPALDGSKMATTDKPGHIHMVLKGKNMMPKWDHLSDTDIAAVITYERNSWSNKTGDLIQPADIKAARQ